MDLAEDGARLEQLGLRAAGRDAAVVENDEGPSLAFNSHLDVVPPGTGWSGDPFNLREANGRLIGRVSSSR